MKKKHDKIIASGVLDKNETWKSGKYFAEENIKISWRRLTHAVRKILNFHLWIYL